MIGLLLADIKSQGLLRVEIKKKSFKQSYECMCNTKLTEINDCMYRQVLGQLARCDLPTHVHHFDLLN